MHRVEARARPAHPRQEHPCERDRELDRPSGQAGAREARAGMMDFSGRHVIVTGGTGALGTAVVGALLEAGAHCHVPFRDNAEADRFIHRNHKNVTLTPSGDLSVEGTVTSIYGAVPSLWASIHLAGGFAPGTVAKTGKAELMQQIESNLVSAFLCCRAAVNAMKGGGRIVNVAARPALEWRTGAGLSAYTAAKA